MQTEFSRLLALRAPIVQAPIGPAAGPELAAAVSEAGGLGTLAPWTLSPERVAQVVRETASRTRRPFAVNLRADLDQHEHAARALDAGAAAIHLFWGDPTPYVRRVQAASALAMATVADADEAQRALDAGVDVLVAQGSEAGGHVRGRLSTMVLVPRIAELAGPRPVIAAGGIVDGAGLAAALMLGAEGVAMGTRFVAAVESRAHDDYKARLVAAPAKDTVYTTAFDGGWPDAPHRVLRNSTLEAWEAAGRPAAGARPGEGEVVGRTGSGREVLRYAADLPTRAHEGDLEAMALYAGQGVGSVTTVEPAAAIVAACLEEATRRLGHWGAV